jgi:hypothetical protein
MIPTERFSCDVKEIDLIYFRSQFNDLPALTLQANRYSVLSGPCDLDQADETTSSRINTHFGHDLLPG